MQRVRLQCLARGFRRYPVKHAGAKKVDDDGGRHDEERPPGRLDQMAVTTEQALQRLPDHNPESRNRSAVSARADTLSTLP